MSDEAPPVEAPAPVAAAPAAPTASAPAAAAAGGASLRPTKTPNALAEMELWAAACNRERDSPAQWNENWGEVFCPGESYNTEDVIKKLESRATDLKKTIKKIEEKQTNVEVEYKLSPYRVRQSGDLLPAQTKKK